MIKYLEGDIFDSPAQVIVNTVNTVGVMGKGLALSFKKRYPRMFEGYKRACDNRSLAIGKLMLFYEADHWLLLFPTKQHWRNPSKLEYIEAGLQKFAATYAEKSITSIAFPRLGCGNGELNWDEVRPLMEKYLGNLPIDIYIYLGTYPYPVPEHREPENTMAWLKENAKDMSYRGFRDGLAQLCGILPYEYYAGSRKYSMTLSGQMLHIAGATHSWEITDDELHEFWDALLLTPVVGITACPEKDAALCALLHSAGYMSKVRLIDNTAKTAAEGYQLNEGLGRALAFRDT